MIPQEEFEETMINWDDTPEYNKKLKKALPFTK
jgi:hypothetical protein